MYNNEVNRPSVLLKDSNGEVISVWDYEFQAIAAANELEAGTFTIERPDITLVVGA